MAARAAHPRHHFPESRPGGFHPGLDSKHPRTKKLEEVALKLFVERGLDAVTVDDIKAAHRDPCRRRWKSRLRR
ncbi:hypothetical protein VZQ01_26355 [Myxococcus faecalis]|uniref:hypothetical protein n=1 Tax=Myxococcus faecalis TaxID=3115646 RepID=UPI003CF89574